MTNLPVPAERTWSVNDIVGGALLNSNLRDGINFLLNPPTAQVSQTATQSLANTTFTPISFDVNILDTYGGHSTTVNNTRYTAQVAGIYQVSGIVTFASNSTGDRAAEIGKNGSGISYSTTGFRASTGTVTGVPVPGILITLAVGDYVEILGWQSSGGALSTQTGASSMFILWVHA